jgi:hypothetical protein
MGSDFYSMKHTVNQARRANKERFENNSKKRLIALLTKKFQTTMIGALAQFEDLFGDLWGHGIPETELTDDEQRWRERWEIARTEILNNGNNNLRAAMDEISQYTITWNRYHKNFIVREDEDYGRRE